MAGQTAIPEIWIDKQRVAATKVCLLEPKLLDPKWLETLKWSFWWITGGWLWTNMNVRKSWEWQTGLHIIRGFPSRNPSRFSLWGSQKNLILVVAGGGANEPLWTIPRVFSITKAYAPGQMIFAWTQFWNHIQAGKMEFLFTQVLCRIPAQLKKGKISQKGEGYKEIDWKLCIQERKLKSGEKKKATWLKFIYKGHRQVQRPTKIGVSIGSL